MRVEILTFNPFEENCYIIWDKTKDCLIIDPGCCNKDEEQSLSDLIQSKGLNPVKLINTHCHIDHILGNKFVSTKWKLTTYMHNKEIMLFENSEDIANIYGFSNYKQSSNPIGFLNDDDILRFGESELQVLFTPGHSPGHICLYSKIYKFLIGGDVIFNGGIGRTDLPGGNFETLINSIHTKLLTLQDSTIVYSGHGRSTTIGNEKQNNPFLR